MFQYSTIKADKNCYPALEQDSFIKIDCNLNQMKICKNNQCNQDCKEIGLIDDCNDYNDVGISGKCIKDDRKSNLIGNSGYNTSISISMISITFGIFFFFLL
jgi:hypothetical protein